jgi:hypothetical protein
MVTMLIAIGAVVVVALGAVAAKLMWRPHADEVDSVRTYQHALGTMEQLAERNRHASVRILEHSEDGAGSGPGPDGTPVTPDAAPGRGGTAVPPVPVRGNRQFPDPDAPLVFDDAALTAQARHEAGESTTSGFRSERARKQALQSMNHRQRRLATTVTVVVLLVAFGALAYVGSRRTTHLGASHTASSTTRPATVHHPTTTSAAPKHHSGHQGKAPTTTTAPATVVATSSTATTAVYPVATASYQVTIAASGPCWVDATSSATGATLFTGTLTAGAQQVVAATGAMTLELGAPTATLALGSVPVAFPTPMHAPFTATFQPGATAPAGSSGPATSGSTGSTGVTSPG